MLTLGGKTPTALEAWRKQPSLETSQGKQNTLALMTKGNKKLNQSQEEEARGLPPPGGKQISTFPLSL
jgi:hypothetical protein